VRIMSDRTSIFDFLSNFFDTVSAQFLSNFFDTVSARILSLALESVTLRHEGGVS